MYLDNIKLWNFRKYGTPTIFDLEKPNLDLSFNHGLNVLIGENDSGKTAIIDAIKFVLKTHSYEWFKISHDDFHAETTRLRIELVFKDLADNEAKNFTEWLGWEGSGAEAKSYLRLVYDVNRSIEDYIVYPSDVKAGVDEIGSQLSADAREYLKVTYLRPLRDAQAELIPKRNSRLSQILQGHEAFKGMNSTHSLSSYLNDFNSTVEQYFLGNDKDGVSLSGTDTKGKELKAEIDKYIHAFYGKDKESEFGVLKGSLKGVLEKLELSIKDELNPGLGTLNRLFMASELLHLQKNNWDGLRLGLIEELEAHLHPQAQMQIINSLQKEKGIQLILTTHSPNLGSKLKLENLILCHGNSAYPLGADYTQLEADDYLFLERFLDVTKANLFFAKGVIFVEGWAEEILLPSIVNKLKTQGIISKDLTEAGVSIVNIGNTAFLRYSRIFLRKEGLPELDIPISIVTDVDVREYDRSPRLDENDKVVKNGNNTEYVYTKRDSNIVDTESSAKAASLLAERQKQKINVFVAPNWTLEYSLSKSTSFNEKFNSVFKIVHPQIDLANSEIELAAKLINKGLNKTEIAYRLAKEIDSDESFVIDVSDTAIKYIIDAIKYACND